jgi:uncharacterized RDD family membrane protein YckC
MKSRPSSNPIEQEAPPTGRAPVTLRRRLAAMTYEAILLFGVVFIADYLFDTLTQSRSADHLYYQRQVWIFLVVGWYFVWFWTHGGQTLPMKTWHIRVISPRGGALTTREAILRYILAWLMVLPLLALIHQFPVGQWTIPLIILAWFLPLLWMLIDRDGQFIHDRIVGTRIIASRT